MSREAAKEKNRSTNFNPFAWKFHTKKKTRHKNKTNEWNKE